MLNVVGLTRKLLPHLRSLSKFGEPATIGHVTPAVTCCVQATYLTGTLPREHGIVGNGWYFRDECEVRFWHQSDKLVQQPRIWSIAKDRNPAFTCANLFWWNAMYSAADFTVTPRPMYPADGRKIPDIWTNPPALRSQLQQKLGQFPLFKFWGPMTSIESTRWIAESAVEVDRQFNPTLSLVYLPHLDYVLQRSGPDSPETMQHLAELDQVVGRLISHFAQNGRVIVLSEYGIEPVSQPVHLNRVLRENGLITVREELGREILDVGASAAFAVADHQVAHVYVNDMGRRGEVKAVLQAIAGVAAVYDRAEQQESGIDHARTGDLLLVAKPGAWFTYYFWKDDALAPDYARTVDIHRKPGYDPVELFTHATPPVIGWKLLKRKLGFRGLLDVIPLDASLVKGSHGAAPTSPETAPIFLSSEKTLVHSSSLQATEICDSILRHVDL